MKLVYLFALHFIADFLLQSRTMGKKKSSDWYWLLGHLLIQFLVFLPFTNYWFAFLNAFIHGIIDRNIWNLYKLTAKYKINKQVKKEINIYMPKFKERWEANPEALNSFKSVRFEQFSESFKYWEDHIFYSTIGLDQFLHTTTIILLAGRLL